jgi:hypothetical protein
MKERWIEPTADADQNQAERFDNWLLGKGIPFVSSEAEADYQARVTLMKDAIQLKKPPSRIPICPSAGFFPIQYANVSMYDAMYDYEALTGAWERFCNDLTPDAYNAPTTVVPGRVLDILDFKLGKWPGHGASEHSEYQYVEKEYMQADE